MQEGCVLACFGGDEHRKRRCRFLACFVVTSVKQEIYPSPQSPMQEVASSPASAAMSTASAAAASSPASSPPQRNKRYIPHRRSPSSKRLALEALDSELRWTKHQSSRAQSIVYIEEIQEKERRLMTEISEIESRKAVSPSKSDIGQCESIINTGGKKMRLRSPPSSSSTTSIEVMEL